MVTLLSFSPLVALLRQSLITPCATSRSELSLRWHTGCLRYSCFAYFRIEHFCFFVYEKDGRKAMADCFERSRLEFPWWVAFVFLGLSAGFAWDLGGQRLMALNVVSSASAEGASASQIASAGQAEVGESEVDPRWWSGSTVREPGLIPRTRVGTFEYDCGDCHQHFSVPESPSGGQQRRLVAEHTQIDLDHGSNDRCLNCHRRENVGGFADHDGSEIPYSKSEDLCRKCHGPKFRDFRAGIHGGTSGYWNGSADASPRATCIGCHDPHSPRFKPIKPAPGPIVNDPSARGVRE